MSDVFDALGHPARRALVDELRTGPARAGDLGGELGMSREAVSKHLRVLVSAGLAVVEQRGRERWYRLEPGALREVDDWLVPYRVFWSQRLDALGTEIARGRRRGTTSTDQPSAGDLAEPFDDARQGA